MTQSAGAGEPGTEDRGCFLCENPRRARDDETFILQRGAYAYVLLNRYPYNTGHIMVAPYAHVGDLATLDAETGQDLWRHAQGAVRALTQEYGPDGFNVGMNLGRSAGAGAPDHLHIHVVPRWNGDTNFMPVTADTKVLPESLERTYQRLRPHFAA